MIRPSEDCRRCGELMREVLGPTLPDQREAGRILANTLGVSVPDPHRWWIIECTGCGHLVFGREPEAKANARVEAARIRAETLRRELAKLEGQ